MKTAVIWLCVIISSAAPILVGLLNESLARIWKPYWGEMLGTLDRLPGATTFLVRQPHILTIGLGIISIVCLSIHLMFWRGHQNSSDRNFFWGATCAGSLFVCGAVLAIMALAYSLPALHALTTLTE